MITVTLTTLVPVTRSHEMNMCSLYLSFFGRGGVYLPLSFFFSARRLKQTEKFAFSCDV